MESESRDRQPRRNIASPEHSGTVRNVRPWLEWKLVKDAKVNMNGFYGASYQWRKHQGKYRAANEEFRQLHAKGRDMAEVLGAFAEKVFPQASRACTPSNKVCGGEEHSESLKGITLGTT